MGASWLEDHRGDEHAYAAHRAEGLLQNVGVELAGGLLSHAANMRLRSGGLRSDHVITLPRILTEHKIRTKGLPSRGISIRWDPKAPLGGRRVVNQFPHRLPDAK